MPFDYNLYQKEYKKRSSYKEKQAEYQKKYRSTPEFRKKNRERMRIYRDNDEFREYRRIYNKDYYRRKKEERLAVAASVETFKQEAEYWKDRCKKVEAELKTKK